MSVAPRCPVLISTASAKSFGHQCPNIIESQPNEHGLHLCKKHQHFTQTLLDANIHDVTAAKLNKDIRAENNQKNIAILAQHLNELPLYNKMREIVAFCQVPTDKMEEALKHSWYLNKGNAYNEKKETIQQCINSENVKVEVYVTTHVPNTSFITLKNNKRVIVDADKLRELNQFTWHENNNTSTPYIETDIKSKKIKMSRYLMNPEPNEDVMYLNNDTYDNRVENLKVCAKGMKNDTNQEDGTKKYIGVRKTPSGKFQARYVINGKHKVVGTYDTPLLAHLARVADMAK